MCGITGVVAFSELGRSVFEKMPDSLKCLSKRGPDGNGTFQHNNVLLGHTRLAIIDTSHLADQPFTDSTGNFTIIFNGEIFNYRELKRQLQAEGIIFKSESDTEVLLELFKKEKELCVLHLHGFFAFAVYNKLTEELFIARSAMGSKPLHYYYDDHKFIFSSEIKGLLPFGIPQDIDSTAISVYLHLNYIPAPISIYQNIKKLEPGQFLFITNKEFYIKPFPSLPEKQSIRMDYTTSRNHLRRLLEKSVVDRLVSDVPLGCFLSGGIDSSIITGIAAAHVPGIKTFSLGFKSKKYFDETRFAEIIAKKFRTDHYHITTSYEELASNIPEVLEYLDEPFADSSAIAVYTLSKYTRKHVTVALSGDGADELFGGYNKHKAMLMAGEKGLKNKAFKAARPLLGRIPQSRNNRFGNIFRKFRKYSEGLRLEADERYWNWAGYRSDKAVSKLYIDHNQKELEDFKKNILYRIKSPDFNEILITDQHLVLQNDMLVKTDTMSMANSLEIRSPFLDKDLVEFVNKLPAGYKLNTKTGKIILKEAFNDLLPWEILKRPKHGFEVPLLQWIRNDDDKHIWGKLLSKEYIRTQNLFSYDEIEKLKKRTYSHNPGDAVAETWGLYAFQYWFSKHMLNA